MAQPWPLARAGLAVCHIMVAVRVVATLVSDAEALALVGFAERVLRRWPEARTLVSPEAARLLAELNEAARAEVERRCTEEWRARLVPTNVAAQRLGIAERTVRWRAATGRLAGEQDARGRWLVEAPG
jgi:hypothetical protein